MAKVSLFEEIIKALDTNFDDVANVDEMKIEILEDFDVTIKENKEIENFIENTGAKVEYIKTDSPCYYPNSDKIVMHPLEAYNKSIDLYGVLFHELVHWSGHKNRLNRASLIADNNNIKMYAIEEMTAEIGAMLLYTKFDVYSRFKSSVLYLKKYFLVVDNDIEELKNSYLETKKAEKFISKFSEKKEPIKKIA